MMKKDSYNGWIRKVEEVGAKRIPRKGKSRTLGRYRLGKELDDIDIRDFAHDPEELSVKRKSV